MAVVRALKETSPWIGPLVNLTPGPYFTVARTVFHIFLSVTLR